MQCTYLEFCQALNLPPDAEVLAETAVEFVVSAATFPGVPHFFRPEYYRHYLPMIQSDSAELLAAMDKVAGRVATDSMLQLYAWHAYRVLFVDRKFAAGYGNWPPPAGIPPEELGMFDLGIALAAIELYEISYRNLGLPEKYAADAASWLGGTVGIHRSGHDGRPGICREQMYWLKFYIENRLFRVGRFEFMTEVWNSESPMMLRRRCDGKVIALCKNDWPLTEDGLRVPYTLPPESAARKSRLEIKGNRICGVAIDPGSGRAMDGEVELDLREYETIFREHEIVPGMHIPGGGAMTRSAAKESLLGAVDFYRNYLKLEVQGFCCFSWIFNSAFERELPESNLADLMRQVYLFPCPTDQKSGLFFVFGKSDDNWENYPEDNSLRRAFHRIRRSNEALRSGGMMILSRDLAEFGNEFYRHNFALPN